MRQTSQLKLASIQMTSGIELTDNLHCAETLIDQAVQAGAQFVILPEYFAIMAQRDQDKLSKVEVHGKGPVQEFLAAQALRHQIWLVGGTHPIQSDQSSRPFARCYVFNPNGEVVSYYDKIHLFDVKVTDNQNVYHESRYSLAGEQVRAFDTPWGKAGLAVCYDLRFPELFRELLAQQVRFFIIPAAFTFATGKAHWEILLKARAVENLCFVAASAQVGIHENGRHTWGHSCIISPWGETLGLLENKTGFTLAVLDFEELEKIRNEFPVLTHRRL